MSPRITCPRLLLPVVLAVLGAGCSALLGPGGEVAGEVERGRGVATATAARAMDLPLGPEREALLADARELAQAVEALDQARRALGADELTGAGLQALGRGLRGDYLGVLEVLGGLGLAGATILVGRRQVRLAVRAHGEQRDASRIAQGLAPAALPVPVAPVHQADGYAALRAALAPLEPSGPSGRA